MKSELQIWSLAAIAAALLTPMGALAAEASDSTEAPTEGASSGDEATPEEPTPPDEDPRAGYIPGYKRGPSLSLSPITPRTHAPAGMTTIPTYAPSEDDKWEFKFTGYASAALRASLGERSEPTDDQAGTTIHAPPRIPDFYGAFNGTNTTPGSWIDLHFQYGNPYVQAHVTLTTWKPGRGADWVDVRSQNFIDQAFLRFDVPINAHLGLEWTVGAFRNSYGGLGQYGAGQYNTFIIGMPYGVGETLALKYQIDPEYAIQVEHGVMGRLGKAPVGSGPTPFDTAQSPSDPSSFVHHLHGGIAYDGEIPWVASLHYLRNWSQDERDQVDDPQTPFVDERVRPDGDVQIVGADVRMINNHLGNFALAVAHIDARDALLLSGLGTFGTTSGEELTKRFLGQRSGGTGQMLVGGFEYNFSFAKFLYHPESFWGEGPDLVASVFANAGSVSSEDPDADGRKMFKAGTEVTYRFFPWLGISGRYDHVIPNSKDGEETFDVISPKLLMRSEWITHEQVTLSYTRWFYGERTHAEFPFELPRDELDEQMFALHFGMWW